MAKDKSVNINTFDFKYLIFDVLEDLHKLFQTFRILMCCSCKMIKKFNLYILNNSLIEDYFQVHIDNSRQE